VYVNYLTIGPDLKPNAAFTHNGFDYQERNLTFLKPKFQILPAFISKFFKTQISSASYTIYRVALTTQKYFYTSFLFSTWLSNLHVSTLCQNKKSAGELLKSAATIYRSYLTKVVG